MSKTEFAVLQIERALKQLEEMKKSLNEAMRQILVIQGDKATKR